MDYHVIIRSAAILLIAVITYFLVGRLMRKVIKSSIGASKQSADQKVDALKRETTLIRLFNAFWKITVICITSALLLLNIFPTINLAPLFASAGILSVAVAFGSQSIVKDMVTGIFIISENQFRVGDTVEINGAIGTVEQIGIRSSILRDLEGNVHYIPNGTIQHVINKTMDYSIARLVLAVDPGTDIKQLIEVINEVGHKISNSEKWKSKILEPPQFSSLDEITGANIKVVISGKTKPSEQWAVTAEIRRRMLLELDKANIQLAK